MSGDASSHEGMKRPSFVPCAARRFVLNYFAQGTQSAPKNTTGLNYQSITATTNSNPVGFFGWQ
jgi:hypothetical protein